MKLKLTNRLNLPKPIVEAVANDPYESGDSDYTATSLLKPPRMSQLQRTSLVTEDASDRLYSLQGQVIHGILERCANELIKLGYLVEKRFYTVYTIVEDEYKVSAQVDLFDTNTGVLSDYKYTSVGSLKHGLKEEHKLQLNLQAELLRRAGYRVDRAEVILLLRDWSAMIEYEGYPKEAVVKQTVPLMPSEEINDWVVDRIIKHEQAKTSLPKCSDEERWSRPTFAVVKSQSDKRAMRVFDSLQEAEDFVTTAKVVSPLLIVRREGKSIRCLKFCPVRSVCEQAKQYQPQPIVDGDGFIKVSKE